MKEPARRARNEQRLSELFSTFRERIQTVIETLEAAGYRPRIQDAWRSPAHQLEAFNKGNSKLKFGFHNVTGEQDRPEALAVDLLDDDFPLNPRSDYLLRLSAATAAVRCQTGIDWGLPAPLRAAIATAVANRDWNAKLKVGWDPTHVEPSDVTVSEAKAGKRPSGNGANAPRGRTRTQRTSRHPK